MSADNEAGNMMFCASCGITGGDDIKLKKCACKLVKYCSVKCQKDHRPQHKRACKKRAAELRDELLFKQPESNHYGDCPICCLPLPINPEKSSLMTCCSKQICNGCNYAKQKREHQGRLQCKCAFCRKTIPDTDEQINEQVRKRIEVNDPVAMRYIGMKKKCREGDYKSAFEYWTRAAALGDMEAHYQLSCLYREGQYVEKDVKREVHHEEQAAIGGHPVARHNLACVEGNRGRMDRAVRHWIIAAAQGLDGSIEILMNEFRNGTVSKEDLASALRAHKAAIDATKSPQRDEADEFRRNSL